MRFAYSLLSSAGIHPGRLKSQQNNRGAKSGRHITSLGREEGKILVLNLYIHERRIGGVTVLDLKGRIRNTGTTRGLHKSIRCLVEKGITQILLNLSQVTHIYASGLDELVASRVTVSNKSGEIKLLHLTEQMHEVITTANLSTDFDIYNNEYDAIASFKREVLAASFV